MSDPIQGQNPPASPPTPLPDGPHPDESSNGAALPPRPVEQQLDDVIAELRQSPPAAAPTFRSSGGKPHDGRNEDASDGVPIWGIAVDVHAVLGHVELTVSELIEMREGQTVALKRGLDEPLDIVVNGRAIARAVLCEQEGAPGKLALRVTELVGAPRPVRDTQSAKS